MMPVSVITDYQGYVTYNLYFQPRNDIYHLMEGLNEYRGLLSVLPDILLVHRVSIVVCYPYYRHSLSNV